MKKNYFLVYFGEDGISISIKTKEEVQKVLDEDTKYRPDIHYVKEIKEAIDMDTNYPCYSRMIIKGEIIVPEKVEVVTKLKI